MTFVKNLVLKIQSCFITYDMHSVSQKWLRPLTFLHIFKYISSWDNTDKMTL